ncbi:hypothetical protein AB1Y20_009887 [Prymnesium parvum]|uniref:Uncharacterized protein n=1 Tax=Prymnesium parvum TaxID=97485 RepID=A0AB34K3C4_PRYPA
MADEAEQTNVVFKKPARKASIRKRDREAEEAALAEVSSSSISLTREIQRQRQRAKGIALEVKSTGESEDKGQPDKLDEHGLENTFTAQTDGGDVDPNMLRYIEEQMQRQNQSNERGGGAAVDDEDGLYTTPAHLRGKVLSTEAAELEDANRWLAGIQEVSLPAEDKMANIEQTELAKRKMMAAKAAATSADASWKMSIPGNFNSNFHQHRREFTQVTAKKPEGSAPPGQLAVASDGAKVDAFRRNEAKKRH